jgi:hypothetical protein
LLQPDLIDETLNVKFRASTSKFPLALDDQEPLLGTSALKEPFAPLTSAKRSVSAKIRMWARSAPEQR